MMEEDAAASNNPSGHISKKQKRDVKDVVRKKIEDDLKSGKYRRSKLVPILWDLPNATLYSPAGSSALEKLHELFQRTFDLELEPLTAGALALRHLEGKSKHRDYEDARPTRFVPGPEGDSQQPDYPWVAKGPEPKDFLGNEFLLWLWHETETGGGTLKVDGGKEVSIVLDQSLELDCAYGQTGRDALRAAGPTRMPEARMRCVAASSRARPASSWRRPGTSSSSASTPRASPWAAARCPRSKRPRMPAWSSRSASA